MLVIFGFLEGILLFGLFVNLIVVMKFYFPFEFNFRKIFEVYQGVR